MVGDLRVNDLLKIASGLSDAVLHQNRWQSALQTMADSFGGSFATFEIIDKKTFGCLQHHDSSDLEIQKKYLDHFMPINPRISFGAGPCSPPIMQDALFMSEKDMNCNEFYADFLRPHDLRYFLAYKAYETPDHYGVFTIQKGQKSKPISKQDLQAFAQLTPSLSQIADNQFEYGQLFARMGEADDFLETASDGILVLDADGLVKRTNHAAEQIISRDDGIALSAGKITLCDQAETQKLARMIFNLSHPGRLTVAAKTLFARRRNDTLPYQIRIQSAANSDPSKLDGLGALLVLIRDPNQVSELDVRDLVEGFVLTPAEATVAILITEGRTANEISKSLNVRLPTTRTHIQRLMQKMGVKRQSDIVRILSRYL